MASPYGSTVLNEMMAVSSRMHCADDQTFKRLSLGLLSAEEEWSIQEHAVQCSRCGSRLTEAMCDSKTRRASPEDTPAVGPPNNPALLRPGESLGRYLVLGQVGKGGMGSVYAAFDPQLDRTIALKVLQANFSDAVEAQARVRLLREAKAIARISHPNVVTVFDVGAVQTWAFVAMEFVPGGTLHQWRQQRPRSWKEILEVYIAAGRGLAAAHQAGLIHRDFKPANVLVGTDGRVRVTDFGLARLATSGEHSGPAVPPSADFLSDDSQQRLSNKVTQRGAILGTPEYMSPEQLRGQAADGRSDQFAFCVALYESLYGQRPYTPRQLASNPSSAVVLSPPSDAHVPPGIQRVLARGLSIDPAQRFDSMSDLIRALQRSPRAFQRRTIAYSALGLLVAAATGLGAYRSAQTGGQNGGLGVSSAVAATRTNIKTPDLQVADVCGSVASVAWGTSGNGNYQIQRSDDGRRFTPLETVGAGATDFQDDGAGWGSHFYRVGFNINGDWRHSKPVAVTVGPVHIDHSKNFDRSDELKENGDAALTDEGWIQLSEGNERGSLFTHQRLRIKRFSTRFTFRIDVGSSPNTLSGLTFTIQGVRANALGPGGDGLGYGADRSSGPRGIRNSLAIKFATRDSRRRPQSTGIFTDGRSPTVRQPRLSPEIPDKSLELRGASVDLRSPSVKQVDLSYDGTTLTETITDQEHPDKPSFTTSYLVDIPKLIGGDAAFVGFTASTEGESLIEIRTWTFDEQKNGGPPTAPGTLRVKGIERRDADRSRVTLGWLCNNAYDAAGFALERSADGIAFEEIARVHVPTTRFTDDVLGAGTYFYRLRSFNSSGASPFSNADAVVIGRSEDGMLIDHAHGFASHGDLVANGTTSFPRTLARLTDGQVSQAGSLFSRGRVPIEKFSTAFAFRIHQGRSPSSRLADGITFTIQGQDPAEVGVNGGGLGFEGIRNSVAIKFDAFNHNLSDPEYRGGSTGLYSNGTHPDAPNAGSGDALINLDGTAINLSSQHLFGVEMNYDGTTLSVTIADMKTGLSAAQTYPVDIPAKVGGSLAYVGFTGSTGALHSVQEVRSWTFQPVTRAHPWFGGARGGNDWCRSGDCSRNGLGGENRILHRERFASNFPLRPFAGSIHRRRILRGYRPGN